ncbi:type III PLP-dependent enzyme [Paenibacillus radicis (ex Gao et al. 2016)]|uniref:Diaminopimelate decarboxylase n=1 Tax=Paenibacillus radicis (ex Gao et al. 2016) TaxID=1737354 RepID=A0A917H6M1_9BACL|nr:type III PLP-dependent enzyme [Paenibacillus radicis (ex Gao et al. 2016)]GGG68281.1 diaminopimelate decarboxylase [Paenibacillus radicis (ex Gao et al. 2016)]
MAEVVQERKQRQNEPFCAYLHDLDALKVQTASRASSLPEFFKLFYAIKANSEEAILRALAPVVHGFEVASLGEIKKVRQVSADIPILFGGPGKTEAELEGALQHNVHLIHVESVHEMNKLNAIAGRHNKKVSVLLRINLKGPLPQAKLAMGGRPTQFGIEEEQLPQAMEQLQQLPNLQVEGFHFHSLSNNLDAEAHAQLVRYYCSLARRWAETYGLSLRYLNAGGGLGVNYAELEQQFDWNHFVNQLGSLVKEAASPDMMIYFECGRYITASTGYYAAEVLDIKRNHGKYYAVVRGGTHHFRLPSSWQHSHPFQVITVDEWPHPYERPSLDDEKVSVVGQLCTPKDVLAQDVQIDQVRVGDILLFPYAGAYGWAISHHDFLSHPHPEHIYLESNAEIGGGV